METDRGAVLTVRAAVHGVIDFTKARLLDPDWWRLCYILLGAVAREDDKFILDKAYGFHLALVGNSGLSEESFKLAQEHGRDTFFDLLGNRRPWEGTSAGERKAREYKELRDKYVARFGDPSSPEFAKKLEIEERWWAEREARRAAERTPEEILYARIAERDTRLEWLRQQLANKNKYRVGR